MMFYISLGVSYIYSICVDGIEYINIDFKADKANPPSLKRL